jgi:prepilin-type N-terminal cleavage/methylation domain-containing protein
MSGKFYQTGVVVQRPSVRSNGEGFLDHSSFRSRAMRTKGFTLVELVVACTLLLMLSTIATTSTYNFVQATANLKAKYNNIQNIMVLHEVLVQAKMNYATDLALETVNATEAKNEIQHWNLLAEEHDSQDLIARLINPDPALTDLPRSPINPGSRSYLPTSRNVQVTTFVGGAPVTQYVMVPITDLDSLLKAYQLTDSGTPSGNIVASISVGPMLDLTSGMRPTLPIIDWKSGTPDEIQF